VSGPVPHIHTQAKGLNPVASSVDLNHQRRSLPERERLLGGPVCRFDFECEIEVVQDFGEDQTHFSVGETVQKADVSTL
jgi:hypothetical protein